MSRDRRRALLVWLIAAAIGVGVGLLLEVAGVPSPTLFGGLVAGCVVALTLEKPPQVRRVMTRSAQAVIGTMTGATITLPALKQLASGAVVAVAVTTATLALSIAAGFVLARLGRVGRLTGVLSMIAGGAGTLTAIARDLGGDERVIAVVQYIRVLLILVTLPAVVLIVFHERSDGPAGGAATDLGSDLAFTAISVGAGSLIGWAIPISTFFLLGPMIVSATLAIGGWLGPVEVPPLVVAACFIMLGLQVGLRFTRESLRRIVKLIPVAVTLIVLVVLGSALLGWLLAATTHVSGLTAYLATTPGGLPAVLAIATDSDADATYVFAVQLARLLLVLMLAPLLSRWLGREPLGEPDAAPAASR